MKLMVQGAGSFFSQENVVKVCQQASEKAKLFNKTVLGPGAQKVDQFVRETIPEFAGQAYAKSLEMAQTVERSIRAFSSDVLEPACNQAANALDDFKHSTLKPAADKASLFFTDTLPHLANQGLEKSIELKGRAVVALGESKVYLTDHVFVPAFEKSSQMLDSANENYVKPGFSATQVFFKETVPTGFQYLSEQLQGLVPKTPVDSDVQLEKAE